MLTHRNGQLLPASHVVNPNSPPMSDHSTPTCNRCTRYPPRPGISIAPYSTTVLNIKPSSSTVIESSPTSNIKSFVSEHSPPKPFQSFKPHVSPLPSTHHHFSLLTLTISSITFVWPTLNGWYPVELRVWRIDRKNWEHYPDHLHGLEPRNIQALEHRGENDSQRNLNDENWVSSRRMASRQSSIRLVRTRRLLELLVNAETPSSQQSQLLTLKLEHLRSETRPILPTRNGGNSISPLGRELQDM